MAHLPKTRLLGPPLNPGVRDLVERKRKGSSPPKVESLKRGFRGWHERGFLPHRDEPGLTQFVTFSLEDAFPANLHAEWAVLFDIEDERECRKQLEAYLDRGRGACQLRGPVVARLVEKSLRLFHGERYDLCAWVVMPNHVHALFKVEPVPMSVIVEGWKSCTCRAANKVLGRRGQFWAEDYWDTFMRDAEHEQRTRRYIENNPVKGCLVRDPKEWPWSSARFRDDNGRLQL